MAILDQLPDPEQSFLKGLECPTFDTHPWATGPALSERRVAIISTAGLTAVGDRPFSPMATDYRVIAGNTPAGDLLMTHVSTNFDRTGFQQDWNVVFPSDRLRALADRGGVGSVAEFHYSFMGATDPLQMEDTARELAGLLKKDKVDAALLVPV